MMNLDGKRALITGASGGLGRQIACSMAEAGCRVAVTARREAELIALAAEIGRLGGPAFPLAADMRDGEAVAACVERAASLLGGLDIVVHCAGMTIKGPLQAMPYRDWDTVLETNLNSTYYLASAAYPYLKEAAGRRNAKFIAIGSVGTFFGIPLSAAYCASKGAVVQLVKALAVEWADDGINVNAICPGYITTPLSASVSKIGETYRKVTARIPMRVFGKPQDIANTALFLASDMSDYITGATINVDGGLMAAAYTMDRTEE